MTRRCRFVHLGRAPERLTHPSEVELGWTAGGLDALSSTALSSDLDHSGAGRTTHAEYRLRVLLLVASSAVVLVLGVILAGSWAQALLLVLMVAAVGAVALVVLWAQRYPERARAKVRQALGRLGGR